MINNQMAHFLLSQPASQPAYTSLKIYEFLIQKSLRFLISAQEISLFPLIIFSFSIYHRIITQDEMRACLGIKVILLFYESFETQEVARTSVVDIPKPHEQVLGGHAVLAVGYDHTRQRYMVRNSRGEDWGMSKYFTMPHKYLKNRDFSDDFWTIRRGELMVSKKVIMCSD